MFEDEWIRRRDAHHQRVTTLIGHYRDHRGDGNPNPVVDFLFTYYRLRPGQLQRWHPGFGTVLSGPAADEYARFSGYRRVQDGVTVDRAVLERRWETIEFVSRLLEATEGRPAQLGCFGLHEWAMVYRCKTRRHSAPLRLGAAGTDAVVESLPLRCTHFDAFRFFTESARPRNSVQLSRRQQLVFEQPGCLHAAMDLYKWSVKLLPLLDSDVVMDAFELAYAARELDMRASPYDLRAYGYQPVRVETAPGRAEYVREQTAIASRAAAVRDTLLRRCRALLARQ